MATDYDAPRDGAVDLAVDVVAANLEELAARRADARSAAVEMDVDDVFDPPGADLLDEELSVAVVPMRADEFRCAHCFLIRHRRQLAAQRGSDLLCQECV